MRGTGQPAGRHSEPTPLIPLLAYLLAVNALAYGAFAYDKAVAGKGVRRVPERTLLGLALAGGSPAALAACHFLRHKTRKQPFRAQLLAIAALHLLAVVALAVVGPQRAAEWLGQLAAA